MPSGFSQNTVHVAIERPIRNEGVMMIGRADDHGLYVFLVEHAPPVGIRLRVGE
jgi:Icc-related predicted phosphoesterase